jgi:hypothetical protein
MDEPIQGYWYVVGFFLFWGVSLTAFGLYALKTQRSFKRWLTTTGTITKSSVYNDSIGCRKNEEFYGVNVIYEYQTGSGMKIGKCRRLNEPSYSDETKAEQIAELYKPGSTVQVFYDPENTGHAYLDIEDKLGNYVPLLVLGLLFFAGAVQVFVTARG